MIKEISLRMEYFFAYLFLAFSALFNPELARYVSEAYYEKRNEDLVKKASEDI